ncbi:MAG TPA: amino acid ABC transporter permease [Candidatus Dormibacteraeota bacterium]|nr:amino acid ABC transporter permease [Candidatus Dormibacteraeota bacterium]
MRFFLYALDPGYVLKALPDLWAGLRWTLAVSAIGIAGSLVLGLAGGAVRAARIPIFDGAVGLYVEFFRNTPLLIQVFFLYFALPELHVTLSAFTVAWLALVLWGGAYNVENFRAGFQAVNPGYQEAARALGLSAWATFAAVILPIGLRTAVPSLTNTCISVLKNSSYMIAISFPELTATAINIVSTSFRVFEMFAAIAVIYLGLVWVLSALMAVVERRLALPEGA